MTLKIGDRFTKIKMPLNEHTDCEIVLASQVCCSTWFEFKSNKANDPRFLPGFFVEDIGESVFVEK